MKGWDNGPIRVDRSNGNDVFLDYGRLVLLLLIQKEVARELLSNRSFLGRGLVHRFLWMVPGNEHIGKRSGDAPPVPDSVLRDWEHLVNAILQWGPASSTATGTQTHIIDLSDDARRRLLNYASRLESEIGAMDEADPRRTYRQKWAGQVARLAGVIHCAGLAATGVAHNSQPISDATVVEAVALASVLLDQADVALGLVGQDLKYEQARRILVRIKSLPTEEVTTAELWRCLRRATSLFQNKIQFDAAIVLLVDAGHLAWRFEGKSEYVRLTEMALTEG